MEKPKMQMDASTRLILARLETVKQGETVTYEHLSSIIEADVRDNYHCLTTVRKHLRQDGMVFRCVRGVGIRRLTDEEVAVGCGEEARRAAGRRIKNGMKDLQACNVEALTEDARKKRNLDLSVSGAVLHVLKPSSMKKIENRMSTQNQDTVPVDKILSVL